eukprot:m.82584 g.82584  ORF g.82584 m.82584 type:complete len:54 (+) comp11117_c0_seq1:1489-1650(+)
MRGKRKLVVEATDLEMSVCSVVFDRTLLRNRKLHHWLNYFGWIDFLSVRVLSG